MSESLVRDIPTIPSHPTHPTGDDDDEEEEEEKLLLSFSCFLFVTLFGVYFRAAHSNAISDDKQTNEILHTLY